jgi:S1-C subfamily serine protease/uncharacterized protein YukE
MRKRFKIRELAGVAAFAVATGGAFVYAQLPVVGGGGLPGGGPSVGPAVGPSVGPVTPAAPNLPGRTGVPNVVPNAADNVRNNVRNVAPNGDSNAVKNGVNNAADSTRSNVRDQKFGSHLPLTVQGVNGKQIGQDGSLGALLDNRNGRLRISQLEDNGLLNASGFRVGDQVLAVNRNWVRSLGDFSSRLSSAAQADGSASVYIVRDGARQWLNVDFGSATKPVLGIQSIDKNNQVVITAVTEGSAAADAGLQVGDQVVSINSQTINATADITAQLAAAANLGELNIDVVRDGAKQTLRAVLGQARDAKNAARRNVELVNDRVDQIRGEAANLVGNVDDKLRDEVGQVRDRVENLSQRVRDITQNTADTARDQVEQVRDSASALKARVYDLADDAQGATRGSLDRIHDETARLRADLTTFAQSTGGSTKELVGNTKQGVLDTAKGLNDELRQLADGAKENVKGSIGEVSNLAKQLNDELADLGDGNDLQIRDRIDAARDHASQLRNRLGDFRNGDLADAIDDDKLADLSDRTAALRDRLHDLHNERFGEFVQGVAPGVQNRTAEFRDRMTQQVDAIRDRMGDVDLGDTDKQELGNRINAIRERVAAGFDGDDGRFEDLQNQLHDVRGRINQLAREHRDDEALQETRDRFAAFVDNVHDYFDDRFDGRGIGDRLAERDGNPVK